LLLSAGVVLGRGLGVETGSGAVLVEIAAVVHGLLERLILPTENVIAVCRGTAAGRDQYTKSSSTTRVMRRLPNVHAVDEGLGAILGPLGLVGESRDVPHKLIHNLGKLDGVSRRAPAATGSTVSLSVGDVALVVGAVEVLAIPTTVDSTLASDTASHKLVIGKTYVGKIIVWRTILHWGLAGISTVSDPEQGAPPTNWLSFVEVQQRWQMLPLATLLSSVFAALPAIIRKP